MLTSGFSTISPLAFIQAVSSKYKDVVFIERETEAKPLDVSILNKIKKETVVVVDRLDSIKKLLKLKGSRKNEQGKFFVFDTVENLSQFKCHIWDMALTKNFMRQRVPLNDETLIHCVNIAVNGIELPKSLMAKKAKPNPEVELAKKLAERAKKMNGKFNKTFSEVVRIAGESLGKTYKKDCNAAIIRAMTNSISYKKLKELGATDADVKLISNYAQTMGGVAAIRAFQDIMYFLTSHDVACEEYKADPHIVETMISYWNPKPTERKQVLFKFNKKPLTDAEKEDEAKVEKWKNKEHNLPHSTVVKRGKSKPPKTIKDYETVKVKKGKYQVDALVKAVTGESMTKKDKVVIIGVKPMEGYYELKPMNRLTMVKNRVIFRAVVI